MSKATFVSEIPSKIEGNEVPTLNLVKEIVNEKEIKSENISDRISEYITTKVYETFEWQLGEGSHFGSRSNHQGTSMSDGYDLYILNGYENSFSIKLTCGDESIELNTPGEGTLFDTITYRIREGTTKDIYFFMPNSDDGNPRSLELDFTEVIIDENEPWSEKVVGVYTPAKEITDMNSQNVMSANAIQGYVNTQASGKIHYHESNEITDKIQGYGDKKFSYIVEPPLIAIDDGITFDKQYLSDSTWSMYFYLTASYKNPNSSGDTDIKYEFMIGQGGYIQGNTDPLIVSFNEEHLPVITIQDDDGIVSVSGTYEANGIQFESGSSAALRNLKFSIGTCVNTLENDTRLMTANAVKMYVEAILKEKELIS